MANVSSLNKNGKGDIKSHYEFDYRKAKPNRFAKRVKPSDLMIVAVEPDVAQVFPTAEAVNQALRTLIRIMDASTVKKK